MSDSSEQLYEKITDAHGENVAAYVEFFRDAWRDHVTQEGLITDISGIKITKDGVSFTVGENFEGDEEVEIIIRRASQRSSK